MPSTDIARSSDFYKLVFGWNIRKRGDASISFDDTTGEVSGTWVLGRPPAAKPGLLFYIMVDSGESRNQCRAFGALISYFSLFPALRPGLPNGGPSGLNSLRAAKIHRYCPGSLQFRRLGLALLELSPARIRATGLERKDYEENVNF